MKSKFGKPRSNGRCKIIAMSMLNDLPDKDEVNEPLIITGQFHFDPQSGLIRSTPDPTSDVLGWGEYDLKNKILKLQKLK